MSRSNTFLFKFILSCTFTAFVSQCCLAASCVCGVLHLPPSSLLLLLDVSLKFTDCIQSLLAHLHPRISLLSHLFIIRLERGQPSVHPLPSSFSHRVDRVCLASMSRPRCFRAKDLLREVPADARLKLGPRADLRGDK